MTDDEARKLADRALSETDKLKERSDDLETKVREVRADWERKRADENVPGAPPPEHDKDGGDERESPAPQAPPPSSGPSSAEMASEGAVGPPADTLKDD